MIKKVKEYRVKQEKVKAIQFWIGELSNNTKECMSFVGSSSSLLDNSILTFKVNGYTRPVHNGEFIIRLKNNIFDIMSAEKFNKTYETIENE